MDSTIEKLEQQLIGLADRPEDTTRFPQIDVMNELAWRLVHINPSRALSLSQQAHELSEQSPIHKTGLARSLRNIATLNALAFGKIDDALAQAMEALALAEEIDDVTALAQILNTIQACNSYLGNYPDALAAGYQALKLIRTCDDKETELSILQDLATVYAETGDLNEAITLFKDVVEQAGDTIEGVKTMALANLAEGLIQINDFEQALACAIESRNLAHKFGMKSFEAFCLAKIGTIYLASRDYEQAISHTQQAIDISNEMQDDLFEATYLINLGRILLKMGRLNDAVDRLLRGLTQAEEIGAKTTIFEGHQLLAEAYEQQGDFETALVHHKRFHAVKEEVFDEKADQKLKSLQIIHDTEKAKREAEIHQIRNKELQKEISERQIAEKSARQRATEMTTLLEMGQEILATLDLSTVLEQIARRAKKLLNARTVAISLKQLDGITVQPIVALGEDAEIFRRAPIREGIGITGHIIQTGIAEIISDVSQDDRTFHLKDSTSKNETMMCAPLFRRKEVIGAVTLWRDQQMGKFTPADLDFLVGIAQLAAIAIENARLFEQTQAQINIAESLRKVAIILSGSLDQATVLSQILEQLGQVIDHSGCAVFLPDEDDLVLVANKSVEESLFGLRIPVKAANPGARVFRQKKLLIIDNVLEDPGWQAKLGSRPIRSWMGAPLFVGKRIIGVLTADNLQINAYKREDGINLQTFANHAALAIENARLFEQAQTQIKITESLRKVSMILSSSLDQTTVINQILEQLSQVINHNGCAVFLPNGDDLVLVAGKVISDDMIGRRILIAGPNPCASVYRDRKSHIIVDTTKDNSRWENWTDTFPIKSWMGAPLMVGERTIGVLTTDSFQSNSYKAEDIQNLQTFANHAALAIENAQLFSQEQETKNELARKLTELSFINNVIQTVTRTADLIKSLQTVAEALVAHLQIRNSGIALLNGSGTELEVVASASLDANYPSTVGTKIPVNDNPSSKQVLETHASLLIENPQSDPLTAPIHDLLKQLNTHRLLIVPLMARGEAIGTIGIDTDEPNRMFSPADIQLVETVAGQIAGAIGTAHLFEKEQKQRQVAESLQQVATVINTSLDQTTVISKILEQLSRVIRLDGAGLFLAQDNNLILSGGYGFDDNLIGYKVPLDSQIETARVFHTQIPSVTADVRRDPHWDQQFADTRIRSWMAVPLVTNNQSIGVLTADCFIADAYVAGDVRVLQTFANQAATAIENAHLFEELAIAKEAAETANSAKSTFLSTMSHELRTPLNGILGYAQILKQDSHATPEQIDSLEIIEQSGNHLLTLINDLLDLAKIEAGRLELEIGQFNLPHLLKRVYEMMRVRAEQKHLSFELSTQDLPTFVIGDEQRLRQVLINLLGNAVKFTDRGKISLMVENLSVESSRSTGNLPSSNEILIRFSVRDTGIGLATEDAELVFEPFHQVPQQHLQSIKGTGLGLAISRNMIQLMNGTISAESTPGEGSVFWFEIPLQPSENTAPETLDESKLDIIGTKGSSPIILVIDEDATNKDILTQLLLPLGFKLMCADGISNALAQIISQTPDAVIAGIKSTDAQGLEWVRQIKSLTGLESIPTVATSANAYPEFKAECLAAGYDVFLTKPLNIQDLLHTLQQLLNIEYLYQEPTQNHSPTQEEAMIFPHSARLNKLLESTRAGDIKAIQQEIARLESKSSEYRPFVAQIKELIDNFELDKLYKFLTSA